MPRLEAVETGEVPKPKEHRDIATDGAFHLQFNLAFCQYATGNRYLNFT